MGVHSRVALGIDVGGTKIASGRLVVETGDAMPGTRVATQPGRGAEPLLATVGLLLECLVGQLRPESEQLVAIGVGVAELVTPDGAIVSDATIPWRGIDLARQLEDRFGVPVVVEADVRAAARGEARRGAGRGRNCFCYVTIGTGISSCLVLDGRPYLGARGLPGTFASSPRRWRDEEGTWRQARPLEQVASGPALAAAYARHRPPFTGDAREVLTLATRGDALAAAVVRDAGREAGIAVGELVNLLDPECIVLGGGLGSAAGLYRDALEEACRETIWSDEQRTLPILSASLGPEAGWIGAAVTASERSVP